MKIIVPSDIGGGQLKVLPEGPCKAVIQDIFFGLSQKQQPKATVKWIVTEMKVPKGYDGEVIGEAILDTYSLQSQALWRINSLFKAAAGEDIPQKDYEKDEFMDLLKETLIGGEFNLILKTEVNPNSHEEQTKVEAAVKA